MTERQDIEWKASWRDEYLGSVCAFANAHGGVLDVGRDDTGRVVRLPNARRLLVDLPNKMRDLLGIVADVDLLSEEGADFIRITVEPYPYPVSYRGDYYMRSGSTTQRLKGAALDRFLLGRTGKRWDGVPVPRVGVSDLDRRALDMFRERAARSGRVRAGTLATDDATLVEQLRLTEQGYLNSPWTKSRGIRPAMHPG